MNKINVSTTVLVVLLLVSSMAFFTPTSIFAESTRDDLEYKVDVSRQLVPLYAVDSKGNPVYDLEKEDLILKVNGKVEPIDFMSGIFFNYETEIQKKVTPAVVKKETPKHPGRMIFVLIDGMYNSAFGLRRAKKIASKLVEQGTPGDSFIIMQSNRYGRMKKIAGPEKDRGKLKKAVARISTNPAFLSEFRNDDISTRRFMDYTMRQTVTNQRGNERLDDRVRVKFFCDFISRLKYILEAISMPKVVFLISEGIPEILSFGVTPNITNNIFFSPDLHERVVNIVKEINEGGSMLFSVYSGRAKAPKAQSSAGIIKSTSPESGALADITNEFNEAVAFEENIPFKMDSGSSSLKTMAAAGKGQYFEGSTATITNQIRKTTSAYYELAFFPKNRTEMKIKIKCRRKGVYIRTLGFASTRKPYAQMNEIRKKVFAMNVVLGRKWAMEMCTPKKARFRLLKQTPPAKQNTRQAEVLTEDKMREQKVDKFLIRFNKDLKNVDIAFSKEVLKETTPLVFKKVNETDKLYFLLIDPATNLCVYNRIK